MVQGATGVASDGLVRTTWLQSPVTALCVDEEGATGEVFFAVGNAVWQSRKTSDGNVSVSLSAARLALELPRGCVITALCVTTGAGNDLPCLLLAATADRVFAAAQSDAQDDNMAWQPAACVLCTHGERVLRIRGLGTHTATAPSLIAVMTVAGTVFVLNTNVMVSDLVGAADGVTKRTNAALRATCTGPATGVTFAMDCVTHLRHKSAARCCHVLVATYAGEVVEWSFAPPSTLGLRDDAVGRLCPTVHSRFTAHRPGCAVFALHAFYLPEHSATVEAHSTASCPAMYVATCGDDRTATLYCRAAFADRDAQTMTPPSWLCLWRGHGEHFSRGRVFDVALRLDAHTRRHVWCAVGSEDGGVQVVHIPLQPSAGQHDVVLHRAGQHGGHGVYKVALLTTRTAATAEHVVVVSGGFDGSVACTRACCDHAGLALPVLSSTTHKTVVRGVAIDQVGCTVVCTTHELLVLAAASPLGRDAMNVVHRATWRSAVCERATRSDTADVGVRDCLPTSLAVLDVAPEVPCAVLAMKSGCMVVLPYRRSATMRLASTRDVTVLDDAVTVCHAWKAHGECVRLAAIALPGLDDDDDSDNSGRVVSVHIMGAVLVTRLKAAAGASSPRVAATHLLHSLTADLVRAVSLLHVCLMPGISPALGVPLLVVIGSKRGTACCLMHRNKPAHDAGSVVLSAGREMQIFAADTAITAAYLELSHRTTMVLVAHDGGIATLPINVLLAANIAPSLVDASPALCPHPLRFCRSVAHVLLASAALWVTQYGTTVTVHARTPVGTPQLQSGWYPVASYANVKAPRLLTARRLERSTGTSASSPTVFFAHCSDGRTVQVKRCDVAVALSHDSATAPLWPSRTASALLHGGVLPGKDFNCCLHLPTPLPPHLLCGGEDSSLTCVTHGDAASALSLYGPHQANILALCVLPLAHSAAPDLSAMNGSRPSACYVVTVGGAASIALWRHDCSTTASQWQVRNALCDTNTATTTTAATTAAVPRYLAVCAVGSQAIVVGGSDARLRCYTVHTAESLQYRTCLTPNPAAPKPILALSTLTTHSTGDGEVMAGDSNGMLFLIRLGLGAEAVAPTCCVLAQLRVEASAVNAISAARPWRTTPVTRTSWLVATLQDSGIAHLFAVESGQDETTATLTRLSSVTAGITAGRGICWSPVGANELLAVCEGNLARLALHSTTLELRCHSRMATNIRGVSGMTAWCDTSGQQEAAQQQQHQECMVAIAGQGIELLALHACTSDNHA